MEETLVLKRDEIFSSARLLAECGLNFSLYLRSLNFSGETEVIVLPSDHHFFYDGEELQSARVVINLKSLNLIKHPDKFLDTIVRILPANACFVGCFSDSKSVNREKSMFGYSVLFNRFLNFLDSRIDYAMDKDEVSDLLSRKGLQTLDMREINGLTYFYCRKVKHKADNIYFRKIV